MAQSAIHSMHIFGRFDHARSVSCCGGISLIIADTAMGCNAAIVRMETFCTIYEPGASAALLVMLGIITGVITTRNMPQCRNFLLRNNYLATRRTLLALGQACFGAGWFLAGDGFFSMPGGGRPFIGRTINTQSAIQASLGISIFRTGRIHGVCRCAGIPINKHLFIRISGCSIRMQNGRTMLIVTVIRIIVIARAITNIDCLIRRIGILPFVTTSAAISEGFTMGLRLC